MNDSQYFYSPLDGMLELCNVTPALNLLVPICTPGWRRHCESKLFWPGTQPSDSVASLNLMTHKNSILRVSSRLFVARQLVFTGQQNYLNRKISLLDGQTRHVEFSSQLVNLSQYINISSLDWKLKTGIKVLHIGVLNNAYSAYNPEDWYQAFPDYCLETLTSHM